jgi:hypothetical protein
MARKLCSLKSCNRPHSSHGYCSGHWLRVYHTGDPQEDKPIRERRRGKQPEHCQQPGCMRRPVVWQGNCAGHRHRIKKLGAAYPEIPIGDHAIRKVKTVVES